MIVRAPPGKLGEHTCPVRLHCGSERQSVRRGVAVWADWQAWDDDLDTIRHESWRFVPSSACPVEQCSARLRLTSPMGSFERCGVIPRKLCDVLLSGEFRMFR